MSESHGWKGVISELAGNLNSHLHNLEKTLDSAVGIPEKLDSTEGWEDVRGTTFNTETVQKIDYAARRALESPSHAEEELTDGEYVLTGVNSDGISKDPSQNAKGVQELTALLRDKERLVSALLETKKTLQGSVARAEHAAGAAREELSTIREEFSHRISTSDSRVAALSKERDDLRRLVDRDASAKELLQSKDAQITQILGEGEALSKKLAAQDSILRRMRTQLKETEARLQASEKRLAALGFPEESPSSLTWEQLDQMEFAHLDAFKKICTAKNVLHTTASAQLRAEQEANSDLTVHAKALQEELRSLRHSKQQPSLPPTPAPAPASMAMSPTALSLQPAILPPLSSLTRPVSVSPEEKLTAGDA
mmetsp:Transcript_11270/g.18412  ORF Transcript_11270/g.18412 Transcript_11270/m.18412 type:complete len:367 (-) Transcript_11270:733-1833(-)|eukprot:CAMPEP_0184647748 /NCGR_PEP_ID=MMETSP0308-20130426/4731_1 /TAXON_ID=38269 /ORGANISM="Gloeochaete witrockiana, Strain SAG 46.84" /LENGTH=366 /DNA_ID=CAMNT_0027078999 /DNA_START=129 /DNA_END=1229 /DNA_ORIENTATION=-